MLITRLVLHTHIIFYPVFEVLSLALPKWSDPEVGVFYFIKISSNSITKEYGENEGN